MRKKNQIAGLSLIISCVLLLAGCGGAKKADIASSATADAAAVSEEYEYATDEIYMSQEASYAEEPKEAGDFGTEEVKVKDTRKLIRNVGLDVETEEFDVLMQNIVQKTESFGGYVEDSSIYNGSYYKGSRSRNASMTLRIPAERLYEFLSVVTEISNVISKNENVVDVTLQYVDMKSHKEALETEQGRLLELLEQAENVEDIITIESRLSDVRYQIESMESQLRTMDNQVSYSTVSLYINEVKKLTPIQEQTTWEKIRIGFGESLYQVGHGIKNFFIGLIINLPYLVVWAIIITVIVIVIKQLRKRKKKKAMAKQEKEITKDRKEETEK